MKISIASDHAGFDLKEFLVPELRSRGFEVVDYGAHELVANDDYPIYISKAVKEVSDYEESLHNGSATSHNVHGEVRHAHVGIVIGGSGQGEAMVANKFPHIRATVLYGGVMVGGSESLLESIVKLSREHNDANILSLGARFMTQEEALKMVILWLETDFSQDDRHVRRIKEIEDIEKGV